MICSKTASGVPSVARALVPKQAQSPGQAFGTLTIAPREIQRFRSYRHRPHCNRQAIAWRTNRPADRIGCLGGQQVQGQQQARRPRQCLDWKRKRVRWVEGKDTGSSGPFFGINASFGASSGKNTKAGRWAKVRVLGSRLHGMLHPCWPKQHHFLPHLQQLAKSRTNHQSTNQTSKPSQTKPDEAKPSQTNPTKPTKPNQTKPNRTKPSKQASQPATHPPNKPTSQQASPRTGPRAHRWTAAKGSSPCRRSPVPLRARQIASPSERIVPHWLGVPKRTPTTHLIEDPLVGVIYVGESYFVSQTAAGIIVSTPDSSTSLYNGGPTYSCVPAGVDGSDIILLGYSPPPATCNLAFGESKYFKHLSRAWVQVPTGEPAT